MVKLRFLIYGGAIAAATFVASGAQAQDAGILEAPIPVAPTASVPVYNPDGSIRLAIPGFTTPNSVRNRPRPVYDALGIRGGRFVLYPSASAGAVYNSNVLYTETNEESDWALELAPSLRLVSDFSRHALNVFLESRSLVYNRLTSENITDMTAAIDGRIDVLRATNLVLGAAYRILHEPRNAPDLPGNAAKPTRYSVAGGQAAFNHLFNRLQLSIGGFFDRYVFADTELRPPGPTILDNHDRDRDQYGAFAQAGYVFSPGYSAFLRGSINERRYDLNLDRFGFRRDSQGYEAVGGLQFELTRLVVGQIYGGYLEQRFDDPGFRNIGGPAFGAQLEWYPTQLTTVRLDVRRSIDETILVGSSSFTNSHFALGVDHELLRNLIVSLDGIYEKDAYNGTARADNIFGVSVGVTYLMNRNLQFNVGYLYSKRNSNEAGLDYTNHTLRIALIGKL